MSGDTSSFSLSSRIASLVHAHFDALPTRSKPTIFPDGSREWIPMTGIVAVKGMLFTQLFKSELSYLVHVCTVKGEGPFFAF